MVRCVVCVLRGRGRNSGESTPKEWNLISVFFIGGVLVIKDERDRDMDKEYEMAAAVAPPLRDPLHQSFCVLTKHQRFLRVSELATANI
jgi:hypothetical protein